MASDNDMEKQALLDQSHQIEEAEPSLSELQQNVRKAQRAYFRAWSKTTSGKWHKRMVFAVTSFLVLFMVFCTGVILTDSLDEDEDRGSYLPSKVPLEAHIMSKCPDAKDCLHDMILPAMQNVSDKVDFRLSYIGSSTEDEGGVRCMHGREECLGNMVEMCAAKLYPDTKIYLGFVMCLTRDFQAIPRQQLVEDCALEHRISMWELDKCLTEDEGVKAIEMLQSSFNRTSEAAVTKSCTVRLNGKIRCVRDGGEWTECEGGSEASDLVDDILALSTPQW